MRNLAVLFIHFVAVPARLLGPGGVRSLIAESLLLKHQILILNRSRKRSPNLHVSDRILAGLLAVCLVKTKSTFEINNLKKRDVTPKLCTDFGLRLKAWGENHLGTLRILV
jgi:hypothetical protein